MKTDIQPGEETWEEETWRIEARKEQRRLGILMMFLAVAVLLAFVVIYGDARGVLENIYWACEDFWELFFPR